VTFYAQFAWPAKRFFQKGFGANDPIFPSQLKGISGWLCGWLVKFLLDILAIGGDGMSATVFRLPTVEQQITRKPVLRSSLVNVITVTAMKPSFRFFSQRFLSNNTRSLANPNEELPLPVPR